MYLEVIASHDNAVSHCKGIFKLKILQTQLLYSKKTLKPVTLAALLYTIITGNDFDAHDDDDACPCKLIAQSISPTINARPRDCGDLVLEGSAGTSYCT